MAAVEDAFVTEGCALCELPSCVALCPVCSVCSAVLCLWSKVVCVRVS